MKPLYSFWRLACCLSLISLLAMGCQQIAEEEVASVSDSVTTSSVSVTTRAASDVEIDYPVSIYAFNASGTLVSVQSLTSRSDAIRLSLGVGDYKIVALAGYSEGYTLPVNPTLNDVITLAGNGVPTVPMMMGKADYSVTKTGKDAQLEITLSYVVSRLSVSLQNIPSDVESVHLALSSFYTSLTMGGVYGGGGKVVSLDLEEGDDGTWGTDTFYLFPTDTQQTLYSITFEYTDRSETFAYTYPAALTAGSPFQFVGTYSGDIYIDGTLVVNGWGTTVNVNFTFGNGTSSSDSSSNAGSSSESDTSSDSTTDMDGTAVKLSKEPQVGDVWNTGIVMQVDVTSDAEADVLLMGLMEWSCLAGEAESNVDSYSITTGQDWRMISDTEAKSFKSLFTSSMLTTINSRISALPATYDELSDADGVRYLCLKNGVPYTFRFETTGKVTKAGSTKSYLLRAVREVHCKW